MSSDLTASAQNSVREYLAFLRRKREAAISEVAAEFNELKDTRLLEETYTVEEVTGLLDGLLATVRANMRRELTDVSHSSALLLVQIFEQLDAAGGAGSDAIELDILRTEDGELHRAMSAFDADAAAGGTASLAASASIGKPTMRALPKMGGSMRDFDAAKENAAVSAERALKLQTQLANVLKEKSALGQELEAERRRREDAEADAAAARATAAGGGGGGESAMSEELRSKLLASTKEAASLRAELAAARASGASAVELETARAAADALERRLAIAESELAGRLEASSQVKSMRLMIQKKTQVVRALREQLSAAGISSGDIDASTDD